MYSFISHSHGSQREEKIKVNSGNQQRQRTLTHPPSSSLEGKFDYSVARGEDLRENEAEVGPWRVMQQAEETRERKKKISPHLLPPCIAEISLARFPLPLPLRRGRLSRAAARIAEKIWLTFRVSALEKSLPSKLPSFPPLSLHLPARDEMPAFLAAFRYQHKEKRREGRKYCVKVGITREGALPTREEVLVSLHRELHYNVTKLTYRSCMMQLVQTTWLKSSITLEFDDMERRFFTFPINRIVGTFQHSSR